MLRLAYAVNGDPSSPHTQSGVAACLGAALARRGDVETVPLDVSLDGLDRWVAAAASVRLGRDRWRWALHGGPVAVAARTRRIRRMLADQAPPFDVVLSLRTVFGPLPLPYAAYVDNTVDVARRHWPPSAPWRGRSLERVLATERAWFGGAAHVFATGRLVAQSLTTAYGVAPERVSVVGGGSHFGTPPPVPAGERRPWILFVGRDFERKGGDRLVRAFREVARRVPDARLKLVGTDVRVDEPGVDVLGMIHDRRRLAELYSTARVYALPVRFEPYGISFLEAMAHGLPCVGTDVCAVPEIIEDGRTGRVVAGDADGALAEALVTLLEDPDAAAAMGEAGRRRVVDELNWDAVASRMAATLARSPGAQTSAS